MNLFKKITSFFLAIVFLLSGFGFTIGKMVCLKSGKTKVSLAIVEDCCKKAKRQSIACCDEEEQIQEGITVIKKGDCCDISNTHLQLKDFNPSEKKIVPEANCLSLAYTQITYADNTSLNSTSSKLFFADLPPPLHGRSLLNFISTLTI
ncbi:hypothetical protein BH10BAC1_BH10BAC1_14110 [soil metagenome]